MAVNNLVKRLQNVMRNDAGISGDAQRIEQMTWMFFLKVYDAQEDEWEFKKGGNFTSIIPEDLRWRNWAVDNKDGKAKTGDELLAFINGTLFPSLQNLPLTPQSPKSHWIVKAVFEDINQYMKNGVLLRQVVNIIDEIDFTDAEDRHTFGDIYEGILKDLQSAGNAGEFYTPRALTDFIIQILNPRLGESVADFTSGTGGFLTSALNYLSEQRQTPQDEVLWQNSVHGQEWKPLPYLLSITNLLVHGVDEPDIIHCDSLGTPVSSFKEKDKMDVIAMNPPYGGSTDAAAKSNFPADMRSSETADLFMVLIMRRLKENGRAGVIIPDGFLFGTDGAKLNIKTTLLQEYNVHTIIRLPGSIFSPYTGINTNIIFFDNNTAEGAPEGYKTKETWFYRLDMPEGYKHFSKTKPMRLVHCQPIADWWINRQEMVTYDDEGNVVEEKSRCFTVQQLIDMSCNFDQCKFPKVVDEALRPSDLLREYRFVKDKLNIEVENILNGVEKLIRDESCREIVKSFETFRDLALLHQSFPSKLKQSILQEAISGRLVPQNPDDNAESLLNHINERRAALVKAKIIENKYGKELQIDADEYDVDLPKGWVICKLGNIAKITAGGTPARGIHKYWTGGNIPWLKIADITSSGKYVNSASEYITEEGVKNSSAKLMKKGTLLYTIFASIGEVAILNFEATCNQAIANIDLYEPEMTEYIYYYLKNLQAYMYSISKGCAQLNINQDILKNAIVPLPPLDEQKRIVAKLEEILPQIDKLGKL